MKRDGVALAAVLVGLATVPGACSSDREPPLPGGETHWLGICERDSDCSRGRCLCNVCTEPCSGDGECAAGDTEASCFDTASPGLTSRCAAADLAAGPGLCLARCDGPEDCPGEGADCLFNACVPADSPAEDGPAPERPALPSGHDFADVERAVDFTEPVELPEPRTVIRGDADWLEGKWVQSFFGEPCTPEREASGGSGLTCMHLEVERGPAGERVGHVRWIRTSSYRRLSGPFAPPSDPDAGYPVEVAVANYHYLLSGVLAEVRYRVLDAVVAGERLSFWASPNDLWTDWCRMQTPHPFDLDGRRRHRCVPQNADSDNTDPGKLALCTSRGDWGVCEDASGELAPCACLRDGNFDWTPLCTRQACECSETGCGPNLRGGLIFLQLDRRGEILEGVLETDSFGAVIELGKVIP